MRINELRRSSAIMPRQSSLQQVLAFAQEHGVKDMFITFTSVDKVGINPRSKYTTPNGIYAYPLEYVLRRYEDRKQSTQAIHQGPFSLGNLVPFAGESPYVSIFKAVKPYVDLFDNDQCEEFYDILCRKYGTYEIPPAYNQGTPARNFWSASMYIASGKESPKDATRETAQKWNNLFRSIGCYGVCDSEGYGIIHMSEKTQAVFFSLDAIEVLVRIKNTPNDGANSKTVTQKIKRFPEYKSSQVYPKLQEVIGKFLDSKISKYPGNKQSDLVSLYEDLKQIFPDLSNVLSIPLIRTIINMCVLEVVNDVKQVVEKKAGELFIKILHLKDDQKYHPVKDVNYDRELKLLQTEYDKHTLENYIRQNKKKYVSNAANRVFLNIEESIQEYYSYASK